MKTFHPIGAGATLLVFLICNSGFSQGDLTPPGPPGPIFKTLDQVEARTPLPPPGFNPATDFPITITESGSYYLTQNLTGISGAHGIIITTENVVLDLNGFVFEGVPGSLDGIHIDDGTKRKSLSVQNGVLTRWGAAGVHLAFGSECLFTNVRSSLNGTHGFSSGTAAIYTKCVARENGTHGFIIGSNSVLTDCDAHLNSGYALREQPAFFPSVQGGNSVIMNFNAFKNSQGGILVGEGYTIHKCNVSHNGGDGIEAIRDSSIVDCNVLGNLGEGIVVGDRCTVRGNSASTNQDGGVSAGIHATGDGNRIEGNNTVGNDLGIATDGGGNLIIRNSASNNVDDYGSIAGSNTVGPIADSSNIATSTNPHANYAF